MWSLSPLNVTGADFFFKSIFTGDSIYLRVAHLSTTVLGSVQPRFNRPFFLILVFYTNFILRDDSLKHKPQPSPQLLKRWVPICSELKTLAVRRKNKTNLSVYETT